jgi:FtsP/CotA-like multicopper oxidase with cupredoxin domain
MQRRLAAALLVGAAVVVLIASNPRLWLVAATASDPCAHAGHKQKRACVTSLMPPQYPVTAMGHMDAGGGHMTHDRGRSLRHIRARKGPPDRSFRLVAAQRRVVVAGGRRTALTLNGHTPGPTLRITQGDLVKVVLVNKNIQEGTTLHWHGIDVPAGMDGVAGVTQNAILPGRKFVYRFVADRAGTYWYHSHQFADRQISEGLFGTLIVTPKDPHTTQGGVDLVAAVHTYGSRMTINGQRGPTAIPQPAHSTARVRFVNTNNGPVNVASSGPFQVFAIDGTDIVGPTQLTDTYVDIPAGGRADLMVPIGGKSVRVGLSGGPTLIIGPTRSAPPLTAANKFDRLTYGSASAANTLGAVDRRFRYVISQRPAYLNGQRGNWYHINGKPLPQVPMFMVDIGDTVRLRIVNNTPVVHPMHLHGHRALVISRNGEPATGSPWWVDSLEVAPGETFVLEFKADNPGVWMFHCHNLPHVTSGLMTHLGYAKVRSPYKIGVINRRLVNQPE